MDNLETIKGLLSDVLSEDSAITTQSFIKDLNTEIKKYLNKLEIFYQNIENQTKPIITQYESLNATNEVISYSIFKKLIYSNGEIENLLKEGYILIDRLRTFFTGEEISYLIGIPYRGTIYEQTIDLEELLKYTQVVYNSKAKADNLFKLRMTGKKNLRQSFQESQLAVRMDMKESSTVWSSVAKYVEGQGSSFKNKGNAYEVYRLLVSQRNGKNRIPPPVTEVMISDAFDKVRGNTASSVKGGDYLQTQIKYFSSAPSLITTSLIRNTLTELSIDFDNFLTQKDLNILKTQMKNLFVKETSQAADKIEAESIEQIDNFMEQIFETLNKLT